MPEHMLYVVSVHVMCCQYTCYMLSVDILDVASTHVVLPVDMLYVASTHVMCCQYTCYMLPVHMLCVASTHVIRCQHTYY